MKSILTKHLFTFLFVCIALNFATAQIGSLGDATGDPDPYGDVYLDPLCTSKLSTVHVKLTNLVPSSDGFSYTLPTGYPPMFLKVLFNGHFWRRFEVIQFDATGQVNGVPVYIAVFNTDLEDVLEEECAANYQANNGLNDIFASLSLKLETVTYSGKKQIYSSYPACNYTAPNDIFSCLVLSNGAPPCSAVSYNAGNNTPIAIAAPAPVNTYNSNSNNCINQVLTSFHKNYTIICQDCGAPSSGFVASPNININFGNEQMNEETNNSLSINAYPNPFLDNIIVKYPANSVVRHISLFDIDGKLIHHWEIQEANESVNLDLTNKNLSKGMYFLKVQFADSMQVIKVLKQ